MPQLDHARCRAHYRLSLLVLLFFLTPPERDYIIKGTCFHTAEAETTGCRHLTILVADVNKEGTNLLCKTTLALLAFCLVVAYAPETVLTYKGTIT